MPGFLAIKCNSDQPGFGAAEPCEASVVKTGAHAQPIAAAIEADERHQNGVHMSTTEYGKALRFENAESVAVSVYREPRVSRECERGAEIQMQIRADHRQPDFGFVPLHEGQKIGLAVERHVGSDASRVPNLWHGGEKALNALLLSIPLIAIKRLSGLPKLAAKRYFAWGEIHAGILCVERLQRRRWRLFDLEPRVQAGQRAMDVRLSDEADLHTTHLMRPPMSQIKAQGIESNLTHVREDWFNPRLGFIFVQAVSWGGIGH